MSDPDSIASDPQKAQKFDFERQLSVTTIIFIGKYKFIGEKIYCGNFLITTILYFFIF